MFGGQQILVLSKCHQSPTHESFFIYFKLIFRSPIGQNTKRDSGRKVQLENINAGKVSQYCATHREKEKKKRKMKTLRQLMK